MTKYREIIQLFRLDLIQTNISLSCNASKTTVLGKLLFSDSKEKPAEQVKVDRAGDPAHIIDPNTSAILNAYIFVGVMVYS